MAKKLQPPFDPAMFLASAVKGRSIAKYRKNQIIFSQGNPADAVFYVQEGQGEGLCHFGPGGGAGCIGPCGSVSVRF